MHMTIRKLKTEELPLLTQLFDYNDVDGMIVQNTEEMQNERVAIFCISQEQKLLGELHVCYESEELMVAERDKRAYLFAFRVHKDYKGRALVQGICTKSRGSQHRLPENGRDIKATAMNMICY